MDKRRFFISMYVRVTTLLRWYAKKNAHRTILFRLCIIRNTNTNKQHQEPQKSDKTKKIYDECQWCVYEGDESPSSIYVRVKENLQRHQCVL